MTDVHAPPSAPAALVSRLTGDAGPSARSVATVTSDALRAVRLHLGMDVAFVSEFTGGERVFRHVDAAPGAPPVRPGQADPLEASFCQRVVDGRLPELIPDTAPLAAAGRLPDTGDRRVGAHLSVPIRLRDGRVYGTYCCFSAEPDHSLNERDLAVLRVFADLTAGELDRQADEGRQQAERDARLRAVIAGEGVSMVFQPVVEIGRCRAAGFEALTRFDLAPRRGPDAWFAEAAAAGLSAELELTAARLALAAFPSVPAGAYLAVNVSPATVTTGRLVPLLSGVPLARVVLEITEHAPIESYEELDGALRGLRQRGMRLAVDDAGAGYASFRHILRLQPDLIKLDMTLTRDIDRDPARRALASALIAFARDTGSGIVAEGVETAPELRTLRLLGVTAAQGYYLGRPEPLPAPVGAVRGRG